jgi:hypothetical protein
MVGDIIEGDMAQERDGKQENTILLLKERNWPVSTLIIKDKACQLLENKINNDNRQILKIIAR